jgi:hypothetical protein
LASVFAHAAQDDGGIRRDEPHREGGSGGAQGRENQRLRWTRSTQLDGQYTAAAVRSAMYRLAEFLMRMVGAASFGALFRPWGIVIALLIATWFGWSHIAALLMPK